MSINYNPITGIFTRNNKQLKAKSNGYISIYYQGKSIPAHRLAFLLMVGRLPTNIDHINHDRTDNRWCNLREVTRIQNQQNQSRRVTNTSGVNGVSLIKSSGRWRATITVNGKWKSIGHFINKEDAIIARKEANIKYGFHLNHGE